jgi:group I intron endonuclease
MMTINIYALKDSVTGELRYVGQTRYSLKRRLYEHVRLAHKSERRTYVRNWIKGLSEAPTISLLCETEDGDEREMAYIALFKQRGYRLTNATDGGAAFHGYKPPADVRQRISDRLKGNKHTLGFRHTDETKAKMSRARKGKARSEEAKKNISEGHKKRESYPSHTLEARQKMSLFHLGKKRSLYQRMRISEGMKQYHARKKSVA